MQAAGAQVVTADRRGYGDARVDAARQLDFRCRRLAAFDVLDALAARCISTLGGEIAHRIARAEGELPA